MAESKVISAQDVISYLSNMLGLSDCDPESRITQIIAQSLRRGVFILSPCVRHELENAIEQALCALCLVPKDELVSRIHTTLEQLLVFGEIFEMKTLQGENWQSASLILRPAPPSFVCRCDNSIVILGIAGDELTPLTSELNEQVSFHGPLRILSSNQKDHIANSLREMGLIELSEKVWLHLPIAQSPAQFLSSYLEALNEAPRTEKIEGLRILDSSRSPHNYKDRWVEPRGDLDGVYIARRPQKYGSALWSFVQLHLGIPERFIDLYSRDDRERPCDLAWRLQAAIDAEIGAPQNFKVEPVDSDCRYDFYSPLPSWAERALAVVGERVAPIKCLVSYKVPKRLTEDKCRMLRELMWMKERPN